MSRSHYPVFVMLAALLSLCGCGGDTSPTTSGNQAVTAPTITSQPVGQQVKVGYAATFSLGASGTAPLTYRWLRNGAAIAGATTASYTTVATTMADDGALFAAQVSNQAGSVQSANAKLSVSAISPSITVQPAARSVAVGTTAVFSVTAAGTAPLAYQWLKNGVAIAGATGSSYTTAAAQTTDSGAVFAVRISNSAGSAASAGAILTVTLTPVAPLITLQPAAQTVTVGMTATFSVTATGTAPLTYQWAKNGTAIAGASAASYVTAATTMADNGTAYSVVVANAVGQLTSAAALLTVTAAPAVNDVTTYKNDLSRTGQNLNETTLTLQNVVSSTFGLLRSLAVDGKVDAQPLYLSKLTIAGGVHNTLFVATEHGSVYAFDAVSGAVLWRVSLILPGESVKEGINCPQIYPEIGVTSTPVIDRNAGAHGLLYAVAMSRDSSGIYHQRMHALDITTGAEALNGPVTVSATYPTADGASTTFDAGQYAERAALLLLNGSVYTTWTSHCDIQPYTGWILAFNAATLAPSATLNVGANGGGKGPSIWMAGGGPAVDSEGNIYLLTANGAFEPALDANGFPSKQDFGNSFLKLSWASGKLAVADYFAMLNEVAETNADLDLGSSSALLLPDSTDAGGVVRHLVVGAGKDGNIYVVNRDSMGHFSATANNIWQELDAIVPGSVRSTPSYFNGTIYISENGSTLKAFGIVQAKLTAAPTSQTATSFTYPGTASVISANGTTNGIVWALEYSKPAVLHAYDAADLAHELYNSNQAAANRDHFGIGTKFVVPTIAEGQVFVGTTASIAVFGLLH